MRFKLVGLLLLLAGMALVVYALVLDRGVTDSAVKPQTYCLVAIFLALTVRVLQAERHHRSTQRRRASDFAAPHNAETPMETGFYEEASR